MWTQNIPTLAELKASKRAPLQTFSKMAGTKTKTTRTVKAISRHQGTRALIANTEHTNQYSGHKTDLFGIFDALAIEVDYQPELVLGAMGDYLRSFNGTRYRALQACGADWQEHIRKLQEHQETCALWLSGGNTTIELWGWRKVKRGKRRVYRPRVQLITLAFLLGEEKANVIEVFLD